VTLTAVSRIVLPQAKAIDTEDALREAGRDGYERFALWSGAVEGEEFRVQTVHVPPQTAFRQDGGVCVTVDGPALHALNVWLYEHGEVLGVQVHTHPDDAYHSGTDDTYAIVTAIGGFSLVVPRFCETGLQGEGAALYRLGAKGWIAVDPSILELA
jgi:hypothetical protein